ncbi:MAG: D-glycero-beta-D-manno-heptose 1-phosphate adenylyltransferase [Candidatus Omnitrophica bacterium]|nr:D-glycero-beta-D-manno-heptose 1-phosphate adenylyltransferase [Candidatus Omnitrophota bacterium]
MPSPKASSTQRKIQSRRILAQTVRHLKRQGKRVVFTNGCFDLLHVGHITLLEQAKRLGDVLIVALNSDRSVRSLKGAGRPIVPQDDRARVMAALAHVDYVTVFDEPTPFLLIGLLKPDVLVKGTDWRAKGVVGSELVTHRGGKVALIPLVQGRSTTRLLERIEAAAPRKTR